MSKKFNLFEATGHEAGIIISKNSVAVDNWGNDVIDNYVPYFGEVEHMRKRHYKDVRKKLPGTCWATADGFETDLDIIDDVNDDIPALFGIQSGNANLSSYIGVDNPYSGTVLSNGDVTVIVLDCWN